MVQDVTAGPVLGRLLDQRGLPRRSILCLEHHVGVLLDDRKRLIAVILHVPPRWQGGRECCDVSFAGDPDLAPPVKILY